MKQVVQTKIDVDVDERDLITLSEAARISGRSIVVIANFVDRFKLPWYEMAGGPQFGRKRVDRYTLRSAVMRLPKTTGESRASSSRTKAKG